MAVNRFRRDEENMLIVAVAAYVFGDPENTEERDRKRRRTLPYVLQRSEYGAFHALVQELAEQDPKYLHKFLRMSEETFDELLHLVCPRIMKKDTNFKKPISPEERLAVTLCFLAEGGSYLGMFHLFHIPVSTLAYVIPETCDAIFNALKDKYMKTPRTEEEWKTIQNGFLQKWHFPQCIGAMGGKHVKIKCPKNMGSDYFNYKQYHSIVLFGIVDASYRFLYHEVGAPGGAGDATIWNESAFKRDFEKGLFKTPQPLTAPESNVSIRPLIVGDSPFALSPLVMKPFPERELDEEKRVFNYRLSRARGVVENAFGVLACRFGIFHKAIQQLPPQATKFVLAALALHNFLREEGDQQYCGPGALDHEEGEQHRFVRGQWRAVGAANLDGLDNGAGSAHSQYNSGAAVREALKVYFMKEGAVSWQNVLSKR